MTMTMTSCRSSSSNNTLTTSTPTPTPTVSNSNFRLHPYRHTATPCPVLQGDLPEKQRGSQEEGQLVELVHVVLVHELFVTSMLELVVGRTSMKYIVTGLRSVCSSINDISFALCTSNRRHDRTRPDATLSPP